jgi:aarF domain-containing kinase
LDVGITTIHSDTDHKLVSDVLAAFIRKDGRKAGQHMIENSNSVLKSVGDQAVDEEEFVKKIELITIAASGKNYFMQHLGKYISYICNAASTHHVMLNQAFISSALAVKVQEGIALALDPSVQIMKIAIPIILEGERKHGRVGERAKEFRPTIDDVREWLTGKKTIRYQVFSDDDPYGKERVVTYSPNQPKK